MTTATSFFVAAVHVPLSFEDFSRLAAEHGLRVGKWHDEDGENRSGEVTVSSDGSDEALRAFLAAVDATDAEVREFPLT